MQLSKPQAKAAARRHSLIPHGRNLLSLLLGMVLTFPFYSRALTNGLALTPPLGWNSWNYFGCNVSEELIRSVADAMATNGMEAAGYQFINMDDCWQSERDPNGVIVADPVSSRTSHDCATVCIHVPMSDTDWPMKKRR